MSDTLLFFTNPMSRGRIARWMLEEVGRPYETEILDFATSIKAPAYLDLNPMGKVPAIRHGDVVVTETAAICAYLADTFPETGLAPAIGDPRRGAWYRWLFFAAGPLEAAVSNTALGFVPPPERERVIGYGNMKRVLDTLEIEVAKGPYLVGDSFTAADLYLGAQIGYGLRFGTIERRASLEAYWNRISDRAAYRRAVEIDDNLAKARGS